MPEEAAARREYDALPGSPLASPPVRGEPAPEEREERETELVLS